VSPTEKEYKGGIKNSETKMLCSLVNLAISLVYMCDQAAEG